MADNSGNVQQIRGRQFKRVKNGLDEAEVISLIDSLMAQHDEMTAQLGNVDSLMKSAENKIVEAGKQARDIEMQIEEDARAQAAVLIAEAEMRARIEADKMILEVRENARAETARIHEEAEQLRITSSQRVGREVRERFEAICADLFPERGPEAPVAIDETGETDDPEAMGTSPVDPADEMILEPLDELTPVMEETAPELDDVQDALPITPVDNAEEQEENELAESGDTDSEDHISMAPQNQVEDDDDTLYEGPVELRIPPPIALDRVLKVHRELKDNSQIDIKCFAVSAEDGVKVEINLSAAFPIVKLLNSLSGVQKVASVRDRSSKKRRKGGGPPVNVFQVTIA